MIKRLSVIIALGIALSLSACGNTAKVNEPIEAEKVTEAIESTPEVTEEPETATEEADYMKIGVRKPSLKKAIKASTTGKAKRAVKKAVNPLYGKKGVGLAKSPKRAVKNAVYKKTTVGVKDLLK